jgi:hypothetical protein
MLLAAVVLNPLPEMLTEAPICPEAGENELITGCAFTIKDIQTATATPTQYFHITPLNCPPLPKLLSISSVPGSGVLDTAFNCSMLQRFSGWFQ